MVIPELKITAAFLVPKKLVLQQPVDFFQIIWLPLWKKMPLATCLAEHLSDGPADQIAYAGIAVGEVIQRRRACYWDPSRLTVEPFNSCVNRSPISTRRYR